MASARLALALASILLMSAQTAGPAPQTAGATPAWVREEWTYSTQGTGRWTTDNSAYKSTDEPWEQYGIEWKWGPGRTSVTGRLAGIVRDASGARKESHTMWEFLSYWDPARRELVVTQFGSHGVYGIGTSQPPNRDHADAIQRFHNPDGTTFRTAHRSWRGTTELRQQSYDVSEDGTWTPRRVYTWKLEARSAAADQASTSSGLRWTGSAWTGTPSNLRVLPKAMASRALIDLMKSFTTALDVGCEHCHTGNADDLSTFAFGSDAKSTKQVARTMLTMVAEINKTLSTVGRPAPAGDQKVTCYTCHRGRTKPLTRPQPPTS
jgi:hypothetical protein